MNEPTHPTHPYFDEALGVWVLSRYRDVMAALRDPELWPVAARGEDHQVTRDEVGRLKLRAPVQDALAPHLEALRARMEPLTDGLLNALRESGTVDLLTGYALPLCRELALLVVQAPPEHSDLLVRLSSEVFAGTGSPDDSPLRPGAATATAELERLLADGPMPMGEPTFVAVSQTTPRLLANIWAALLDHPAEAARLCAEPALWPAAVEELLRYAGIVRCIWRQARSPVQYEGATLSAGQKVLLMLASANRDPEQFADPNRLDAGRRVPVQFGLGAGRNSCAGGALVRAAIEISTRALLARYPGMHAYGSPRIQAGTAYAFPAALPVVLEPGT